MRKLKPPGRRPRPSAIEQQIRDAQRRGDFEGLPGEGAPLDLSDAEDPAWWARKLVQREQVSVVPPALEIRRTVERELEKLATVASESGVRERILALNARIGALNRLATSGPATAVALLDVEAIVARWRVSRGAA